MKDRRPEDRLRDANPVSIEDVPPSSTPQARALFERIVQSPIVAPRRSARRRRYALILVPVALFALGAGYRWLRDAPQPVLVACFEDVSLQARRAVDTYTGGDPVALCALRWKPGGPFAVDQGISVPPLAPCVLPGGYVGVFPARGGNDPCSTLGIPHLGAAPDAGDAAAILRVQEALAARFLGGCVGEAEARRLARAELDRNGLQAWTVGPSSPFGRGTPCASLVVDVPSRALELVPIPDRHTP